MTVSLRPINTATDFGRLVEIHNAVDPMPATVEEFEKWETMRPPDAVSLREVAVDATGHIVGHVDITHQPWDQPGRFWLELAVDPAWERQGIGALLYTAALDFGQAHGISSVKSSVRDSCPGCLRFAEQRGFTVDRHIFDSTLDIATFDETPYAGVVEAAEAGGIRFFTLADVDVTEEVERKLYTLNTALLEDVPGWDEAPAPFEQVRKWIFEADHYRPDGQIIAADGDRWVGLAALGYFKTFGGAVNMITGVDRDYRGRKIALALKLLANRTAKRWGAREIRTNNDSQNAPMLAINRKLGYQPEPGKYILQWSVARGQ